MKRVSRYTTPMPKSAMRFVLESLIPYTEANLKLVFKPTRFFNELERLDILHQYGRASIKKAYYTAKSASYIAINDDGLPELTDSGELALQPHIPKLIKDSCVMVIFDIPEDDRVMRRYLRALLRELKFVQVQKSVWTSDYDCKDILAREIAMHSLNKFVQVYESARVI